ncbi:MAG: hypothetical protein Q4E18_10750 [Clostridia bacterium]|nr:hypothetical protein [Clostridia bacterium]
MDTFEPRTPLSRLAAAVRTGFDDWPDGFTRLLRRAFPSRTRFSSVFPKRLNAFPADFVNFRAFFSVSSPAFFHCAARLECPSFSDFTVPGRTFRFSGRRTTGRATPFPARFSGRRTTGFPEARGFSLSAFSATRRCSDRPSFSATPCRPD